MRLTFLGFGLIGGSIARAIRAGADAAPDGGDGDPGPRDWTITAWTPTGVGPTAGVAAGIVDRAAGSPEEALEGAELVVLAAPVSDCLAMLDELAGAWAPSLGPDAVITDVASTKSALVLRATALGLRFVGGHPMAGRETSGFTASDADLLTDRPWVIGPTPDRAAVARVETLVRATGARPVALAAGAHDTTVAAISHLPLLTAAALVEAIAGGVDGPTDDWPEVALLAASGWRDTTRLARGDVAMGTGIVTTNAEAIASRVRDLIVVLQEWLTELERPGGPDHDLVAQRLRAARERLERLS